MLLLILVVRFKFVYFDFEFGKKSRVSEKYIYMSMLNGECGRLSLFYLLLLSLPRVEE